MSNQNIGAMQVANSLDGLRASLPPLNKVNEKIEDTVKKIGVQVNINQSIAEKNIRHISNNVNNLLSGLSKVSSAVLTRNAPSINQAVKKFFFISNITERIKNDISIKINVSPSQSNEKSSCPNDGGNSNDKINIWDIIKDVAEFIVNILTILKAFRILKKILGKMGLSFLKLFSRIGSFAKGIGSAVGKALKSAAGSITRQAKRLFSGVKHIASSVKNKVGSGIRGGYTKAKNFLSSGGNKVKTLFLAGKDKAKNLFTSGREKAKNLLSSGKEKARNLLSSGKNRVKSVANVGKQLFSRLGNFIKPAVSKGKDLLSSGKNRVKSVANVGKQLFGRLGNFLKPAVSKGKDLLSKGKNTAKSLAGRASGLGSDILKRGGSLFTKMAGPMLNIGKSLMSKVPGGIKSAMKTTFTAGKSLLSNPKVLRTLGRVASVGLRVGRMATPIGWASLAAEGAIRLGYHAYKKYQASKENEGTPGSGEGPGKDNSDVYPQTVTPGMAAAASAANAMNYMINSNPQFQINILPGTPEQQINDIRQAALDGTKQGEKQLTATINGGM
ncbi:Phage-related minor tail protein [Pragia fontium]|uniref:hypothetical protein n=1 Tax=Pragia fontium TaxID=82985 RepID=UPI000DFEDE21|nr:hypothetical protein [Pragia fontium]SUB81744.1 Phage-related minor tail protein [Pragia fontium]